MKTHQEKMARKVDSIEDITDSFKRSSIAIVTDYRGDGSGLTVAEISALRDELRKSGGEIKIAKNTLTKRVCASLGIEGLDDSLKGPTAIAFGYDDPAAVAKAVVDFAKANKQKPLPAIRSGYMSGEVLDANGVKAVADLPSLPELHQKLLGLMIAPAQRMMGAMQGNARQMVTVLDAWNKKRGEEG